ncbi:DivIVA domain protein, partial [Leifsonia aquatica ATCC 14665]
MALTPEDVVNKRFQPTKFREGYDQDEVDDFLDEVVVELRRLGQENEELKQRLVAADSRIAELQRSSGSPAATPAPVAAAPAVDNGELTRLQQENEELKQRL